MKLLVFAHTPPPHHGQSYMVQLMIEGFGGDARAREDSEIECYHVNCRYSDTLEDIGSVRLEKMWLVVRYCLEAIWIRFRHGVRAFYFVPAPGKRAALYRDWVVMLLCRPFFREFIHHWEAVGLGDWLVREGTWFERWLTHRLLGRPALGVALGIPSMRDPLWFRSHRVVIVPNGIPDPCPDFDSSLLPRRQARIAARRCGLGDSRSVESPGVSADDDANIYRILFLAHCTREKGVFDTIEGVCAANEILRARGLPLRMRVTVAGAFLDADEETEFRTFAAAHPEEVEYVGFVSGHEKARLLAAADAFSFPSYYPAEGQPVNLIEAIAFGLPVVTTRWRAIPDILPSDYAGFVLPRSPRDVATALIAAACEDGTGLRAHFLAHYTVSHYLRGLQANLQAIESSSRN